MQIDPLVAGYEERRKASGIPADRIYKRAKVPASTVWRWFNKGASPELATLRKLETALEELVRERQST